MSRPENMTPDEAEIWQQLAAALDGGVLVTADGAEVELYGNGGNA